MKLVLGGKVAKLLPAATQRLKLLLNIGCRKIFPHSRGKASSSDCLWRFTLEGSKATIERLTSLVLIIALAYTCASLSGRKIKQLGQQKYVSRLTELGRTVRRHSSFWVGLYGQVWMAGMEFLSDLVSQLMRIKPNKLPFFQRGLRAMALIQSTS